MNTKIVKPIKNSASVSFSEGTKYLSVIYRHPVVKDNKKPTSSRRIRRALGTKDLKQANALVSKLTEIIQDPYWHTEDKIDECTEKYGPLLADIFYDPMREYKPTDVQSIITDVQNLKSSSVNELNMNIDFIINRLKSLELDLKKNLNI